MQLIDAARGCEFCGPERRASSAPVGYERRCASNVESASLRSAGRTHCKSLEPKAIVRRDLWRLVAKLRFGDDAVAGIVPDRRRG